MDDIEPVTLRAQTRVGTVLKDKWRLDRLVGVGGMAAVYAATHRNSKRVAVKLLHPELSLDEGVRQRFLREGYLANRVGHRGAVAVDDDDTTDDGAAFLVMELLDGETLETRMIRTGGCVEAAEVFSLLGQVADTLVAAHEKGIVHRDLKPENLFLTREGIVKVLDFGIARIRESHGCSSATQTGSVMGTPSFMAPEQARGRWDDVDGRTDVWAIGATAFTLLTGRFVHEADTVNEALVMAVTQRAPPLAGVLPDAHPAVADVVDKALAYERESRFQSAAELRDALRAAYAALRGDEPMAPLSVPDARAEPRQPLASIAHAPKSKLSAPTTGGGVSTSVPVARTSVNVSFVRWWSGTPAVRAALVGVALLLAGSVVLVRAGRHSTASLDPKPSTEAHADPVERAASRAAAAPPTPTASASDVAQILPSSSRRPSAREASPLIALATSKPRPVKLPVDPFARRR